MSVPKYYLVKNQILELIAGLDTGAPVPTERDLAERFETSRTTVRQAIADLVVDRLIALCNDLASGSEIERPRSASAGPLRQRWPRAGGRGCRHPANR